MSDTSWQRGLPDISHHTARLLAIAIDIVATVGVTAYYSAINFINEPTQAPACFGRPRTVTQAESQLVADNSRQPLENVNEYTRTDAARAQNVLDAQALCAPNKCEGDALRAYKSAVFKYLASRYVEMERANAISGMEGVRVSQRAYATSNDIAIDAGLRARYKAKLFRINDFSDDALWQVMATLIFAGPGALRPCARRAIDG